MVHSTYVLLLFIILIILIIGIIIKIIIVVVVLLVFSIMIAIAIPWSGQSSYGVLPTVQPIPSVGQSIIYR